MMHLLANSKALLLMTDRGANYKSRRIWMAFNFTVCTFFFFFKSCSLHLEGTLGNQICEQSYLIKWK